MKKRLLGHIGCGFSLMAHSLLSLRWLLWLSFGLLILLLTLGSNESRAGIQRSICSLVVAAFAIARNSNLGRDRMSVTFLPLFCTSDISDI